MNIRSLFVNDDEELNNPNKVENQNKPEVTQKWSFPKSDSSVKFPTNDEKSLNTTIFQSSPVLGDKSNPFFTKVLQAYNEHFDKLNQDGYDFYEFYKAVSQIGVDNQQAYVMAFTIGLTMDKTLNKTKLGQQADYYLSEINNLYIELNEKGVGKKNELESKKLNEQQSLSNDISSLEQQIEALTIQLNKAKENLTVIDDKYRPLLEELENKIVANNLAKAEISSSIEKVKQGINTNIN